MPGDLVVDHLPAVRNRPLVDRIISAVVATTGCLRDRCLRYIQDAGQLLLCQTPPIEIHP